MKPPATTCPRRMGELGPWERKEGLDHWQRGTSFAGYDTDDRFQSCSFCGSLEPELFLRLVEEGWVVSPTDKNYKAYLGEPLTEEGLAKLDESDAIKELVKSRDVGKFYFQHLSEEQKQRFVRLLNERRMRLAYPGYFYRLPFFVEETRNG